MSPLAAAAALGAAAALAGPASAAELLVVRGESVAVVDDPYLPPRRATDLPPPPGPRPRARPGAAAARGPTVKRAVRDAFLDGRIGEEDHDRYRALYDEARSLRRRLSGARRAQLHAVIATLERIAADGYLTVGRMPALFLQLDRNVEFWRTKPFPPAGARVAFAGSSVIFQYYAGQGLQIQPLANFGKANGLYNACKGINTRPGVPCRQEALRELLDDLVAIAARRGDFTAWEYYFTFGGGRPPWTSGLSQGSAIQALARGSELLGDPAYVEVARAALGAFERRPPVGVRVPQGDGSHYLIYSFDRRLRVLNGFLQAVIGLHDYARISADPRGQALFEAGDRAARREVPEHDTGAWSLYARRGRESELSYHRLVRDFLRGLCERTQVAVYCDTAERFTRYLLEHPRVELMRRGPARAGRPARIRFRLSKLSRVSLRITAGPRTLYFRRLVLGHGVRRFAWTPGAPGLYRLRLEAADLRNHHTVRHGRLRVRG